MRHLAPLLVTATLALVTGCKRHDGATPGTTTVRSGTPEGVRVTSAPAPTEDMVSSEVSTRADRLTRAICVHERECARLRQERGNADGSRFDEDACIDEIRPVVVLAIEALECSPAVARAGLEECLAAIRGEACPTTDTPGIVAQCRPSAICRTGE